MPPMPEEASTHTKNCNRGVGKAQVAHPRVDADRRMLGVRGIVGNVSKAGRQPEVASRSVSLQGVDSYASSDAKVGALRNS